MRRFRIFLTIFALSLVFFMGPAPQSSANTLEQGVQELARKIVEKSVATERTTLAVAAFPHADDTCSEMSNYLVDELVLSLFSVQSGQLEIIERSQLSRIFAEMQLSLTGAVDANTTQELGRLYGVDSLLIGSLTLVGETLRVNSRLIDTETGRVFSAAAVSIPKTATIDVLMSELAAGGCTMNAAAGSGGVTSGNTGSTSNSVSSSRDLLPAFDGAVDLEAMVGKWEGSAVCGDKTELAYLDLQKSLPNGLPGRFQIGNTASNSFLALNPKMQNGEVSFTLTSRAGTAAMKIISPGVLQGTFSEKDYCSSVYLGKGG